MDKSKKETLIIGAVVSVILAVIGILIWKNKKSVNTTTQTSGTTTTQTSGTTNTQTSGTSSNETYMPVSTNTNPWIRFNWWGGQKAKKWNGSGYTDLGWSAVGFQLSNPSQLPAGLKPGSVVEVNMEQSSDPSFNGKHTVMYLGDDTKPGDFASGLGALVTVDFPRPDPPTTLPKSGYFRLVSL